MNVIEFFYNIIKDPYFIGSMSFWIIIYILYRIKGKKNESIIFMFPFYVMLRTKKLNKLLKKIGQKFPRFWNAFFTVGVFVSLGFLIYGIYFFINNLIELFISPKPENIIQPLVPGITVEFSIFLYLIIPIGLCIIFHEFFHAMAAESNNINIQSSGLIFGGILYILLPGAFIEPDEYKIKSRKTKFWTKLRIMGAGSFANSLQAIIAIILLVNFPIIINPFYGPKVLQITEVIPSIDGGFNEGKISIGDVVVEINNTKIDLNKGIDLNTILNNGTNIKCFIGDNLTLKVLNKNGVIEYKNITLGPRYFLGFDYHYISDTILQIDKVYDKYQGGNNYNNLQVGMKFKAIDSYHFNLSERKSLGIYLKEYAKIGKVNFTLENDQNISIYIDYYPLVYGAFEFRNYYIGAFFETTSDFNVYVKRVLSSLTENGINDKNLFKGDKIIKVNGINLNISSNYTFEDFLNDVLGPINEEINVKFTVIPSDQNQEIDRNVIIKPIPMSYVFIGIKSKPYWIPKNIFSSLLGSNFALFVETELFYLYIISLSLALFNMMPMIIPPLDGYLMVREFISKFIGIELHEKRKKKIKILLDPSNNHYLLNTYYITDIISLKLESLDQDRSIDFSNIRYRFLDTIGDGYIDTIEFNLEDLKKINVPLLLNIEVTYLHDRKQYLKRIISWSFGSIISIIIVLNFIFSYIFLGDLTFWI